MNPKDSLTSFSTPAGSVDILFLEDRADFIHAIRALACRCEPEPVPDSMGASSISGLINWEKIHDHLREYEEAGGTDPDGEFGRFTSNRANYTGSLIVLSSGDYSAVPASAMGLEPSDWREKSVTIRKYHELTHFYCRKRYPENKEAIRDEVIADLAGITAAFGTYDPAAARKFLGIEGEVYRQGGRLQNYAGEETLESRIRRAEKMIRLLSESVSSYKACKADKTCKADDIFCLIDHIEKNKIGAFQ